MAMPLGTTARTGEKCPKVVFGKLLKHLLPPPQLQKGILCPRMQVRL